jgi:ribonuclease R
LNTALNTVLYSIPSREDILGVLRTAPSPLTADEIARSLAIKRRQQEGFTKRLTAMERDGQIKMGKKGGFRAMPVSHFIAGRIQGHREGYGFLIRDDGNPDLFLSNAQMQKAMHNDRVLVRQIGIDRRGRAEAQIIEVTERANKQIVGRLFRADNTWRVVPEDKRISQDILVSSRGLGKARAGQVIDVELTTFSGRHSQPAGKVTEVIGHIDDPGIETEIAVRKYGIPDRFSEAALTAAAALPDQVGADDLRDRVDLRQIPFITIDGEDAHDFDDAVYCEPVKTGQNNSFRLMVAIADVSHYVAPNSALDIAARERSTSIYFPRRVIPMLPETLSNELCSLNPGVDRCTLVCDMTINAQGKIRAYQFYPAAIRSIARLTYTEAAAFLAAGGKSQPKCPATLLRVLQNLHHVYQTLVHERRHRGALDFDTTEASIIYNAQGKIENILPRTRNEAHKLIEECMLAANVCAASFLKRHKHAGLYRVHAAPTDAKLDNLRNFLRGLGLSFGSGNAPQPHDYQAIIAQTRDRPEAQLLQTMLLRSMQQANYSPDNIGHFGLAYKAYAHFTSPIRRYPDLLVHRAIRAILSGKKYQPSPPSPVNGEKSRSWHALGLHCSTHERRADEATRDVETWLKCDFMRDKLGKLYNGVVSSVTAFGIFVQLDHLCIEGLVHITELGADYFQFDAIKNELCGTRTGIRYQLADRVRVEVSRVDLDARKIDFVLRPC